MSTWKSPPRDWRDEKLWNLLPAIDAPYEYHSLSVAEMEALVETLSDGFGEPWVQGGEPLSLPASLKSGLLEHAFHRSRNFKYYDADAWDDEFWSSDDDGPSPSETFPLGFTPRRLRVYFQNQFNRFCNGRGRDDYSIDLGMDRSRKWPPRGYTKSHGTNSTHSCFSISSTSRVRRCQWLLLNSPVSLVVWSNNTIGAFDLKRPQ